MMGILLLLFYLQLVGKICLYSDFHFYGIIYNVREKTINLVITKGDTSEKKTQRYIINIVYCNSVITASG